MTFEALTIKTKVCITLDANTPITVTPLLNYVPYSKSGYRRVSEYLEINNLKAVSWIYSRTTKILSTHWGRVFRYSRYASRSERLRSLSE
ncbi:MAG: hypothetical protein V7K18_08425 [Nostoc sp.]|uniref:hypothetical protein n=1 Tax=Nostoc sp. TaxID=1180 RepID=UPI002FF575BA